MPGFILHLTAAKMVLDKLDNSINQNDFFVGNILPDTVPDKLISHFRSPARCGQRIEYPELDSFLNKYESLLGDSSVLGYYYHLFIDRKFFLEHLPKIVTFLGKNGQEESETVKVVAARLNNTGEVIPIEQFFSEEYYYGDFTKMNTYLLERYQLPMNLDVNVKNPGIEEVDYQDVKKALEQLESYLEVPMEAVDSLRVFDLKQLLAFLEEAAEEYKNERKKVSDKKE